MERRDDQVESRKWWAAGGQSLVSPLFSLISSLQFFQKIISSSESGLSQLGPRKSLALAQRAVALLIPWEQITSRKDTMLPRKPHIRGRLSSILCAKVYILKWSIFVVSLIVFLFLFPLLFLLSSFFLSFSFFFFSFFSFLFSGAQNHFFGLNCFTISLSFLEKKIF